MESNRVANVAFGILGGLAGGVLGYFVCGFLLSQGLYAIAMPGALLGLGCGLASRIKSLGLGIACAVASLGLGLYLEWEYYPFNADASLSYFVAHLSDVIPAHLIFIGLGGLFGFWFGIGRKRQQPGHISTSS